jgi:hypothetical protein
VGGEADHQQHSCCAACCAVLCCAVQCSTVCCCWLLQSALSLPPCSMLCRVHHAVLCWALASACRDALRCAALGVKHCPAHPAACCFPSAMLCCAGGTPQLAALCCAGRTRQLAGCCCVLGQNAPTPQHAVSDVPCSAALGARISLLSAAACRLLNAEHCPAHPAACCV